MPDQAAPSGFTDTPMRRSPAARKLLYTVDGSPATGTPVFDAARLLALARTAVRSGGGHVLSHDQVVFPNGAVTLVLILAESHLAIHTWPEENLIAIDLFSCGAIDGARVIGTLTRALGLERVTTHEVPRGAPR